MKRANLRLQCRFRLGFIGLGHIPTSAHLPALKMMAEEGRVKMQAFCDSNAELLEAKAKEYGVTRLFTDHRAMLEEEELDAVYLCIPPTLHTDEELQIAERGIPLFVEKPQTLDIAQAAAFAQAISKAGIISQVGFQSRYYDTSEKVVELLAKRTPRHAQVSSFYSGRPARYWTSRMELCGGTFVENTIHMVDLLCFFFGDIESVTAFYVDRKPGEGPEPMNLPHVYNVSYRFASGLTANVTISRVLTNVSVSRRDVLVISDDSLIEWSPGKLVENGETVLEFQAPPNAFAAQADAFITAVEANDPTIVRSPYRDAMNSLAAVLGANRSAELGGELVHLKDLFEENT